MSSTPITNATPATGQSKLSQFAVGTIPAFKQAVAPINYAAAASAKAKPSPPVVNVNGKDAQPAKPNAVATPKVALPRAAATETTSAAVPAAEKSTATASSNGNPKISGAVPAPAVVSKPPINMHAFFTGGGSSAPTTGPASMAGVSAGGRGPSVDQQSRSPQPAASVLSSSTGPQHHNTQLSTNSRSFAPGSGSTPSFVPQQQFSSPNPQYQHIPPSPYQQQQQGSPYLQHPKSAAQNIPNGANQSPYGGPGGPNGSGPRSGSFVGSPVMAHQQMQQQQRNQGQSGGPQNRSQFPTSPRLGNPGLPTQQGMMFTGQQQQWQQPQQQQFGAPYPGYYGYPPAGYPGQAGPGSIPVLPPSGSSTPSSIRTAGAGVPPSPSMAMQQPPLSATSAQFAPGYPVSPQQQAAMLPNFTSSGARPQDSPYNSHAIAFKPSVETIPFVPSPRKSAAVQIRKPPPKEPVVPKAKVEAKVEPVAPPAVVAVAAAVVEKVDEAAIAKKASEDKIAEEKQVAEAKAVADKLAADEAQAKSVAEAEVKAKAEAAAAAAAAVIAAAAAEKVAEKVEVVVAPVAAEPALDSVPEGVAAPATPVPETAVDETDAPEADAKAANGAVDEEAAAASAAAVSLALTTARPIDDLSSIAYPADIKAPRTDLNVDAEPGKYRYDRDFLMQFMAVCQEKPEQLPNLEAIGMLDAGSDANARPGFAGGRRAPSMGPPAVPNRAGGAVAGNFGRTASMGQFGGGMGNFGGAGMSSEDRFKASLAGGSRSSSAGGFSSRAGGSMSRTSSQSGTIMAGANFVPSNGQGGSRIRSGRGKPRDNERGGNKPGQHTTGQGFEDAAPLEATANRWTPTVVGGAPTGSASDPESPEMVQRKVKALLNKLTLEKFDSISEQILTWANKSENEVDGRILRQVIALIFEKATDEANWSEMYARLCRKLMEMVSTAVTDESVKAADGTFVAGGALFRKYLLNRCQEDYESGWKSKEIAAAAAAATAAEDNAKKEANDAAKKEAEDAGEAGASSKEQPKEAELLSDEYYAAQKAKRRGLGLVRFIGELYRLSMLTDRIMHECIKKLLANIDNPEEEDIESLCRLLTTVGKGLDIAKAKNHMDIYFQRMSVISSNDKNASRIRFMIQDVLELRKERWQPRHDASGPKLISEIHSDAQKASEESARRTASSSGKGLPRLQDQLSRPGSRRGQGRDNFGPQQTGADGWSTPMPQRPAKAGDLSSFGKIREQPSTISLAGPSGHFAKGGKKEAARPVTPSNPFALLSASSEPAAESAGPQRTRLVLAPRTVPVDGEGDAKADGEAAEAEIQEEEEEEEEDDGAIDPNAVSMSRAEGERRAGNSVKEFFSVKSLAEGLSSVEALPVEYRGILITAFVDAAMDLKADQVSLTRQLFAAVATKSIVSHGVFLKSLTPLIVGIVDLAVDIPSAYTFAVQLLIGAGITQEETVALSKLMESEEEDEETVEAAKARLLSSFEKAVQA